MFDITSSKMLLLAVVALLVIGPKDFPVLLRTIGKYVGIIRGHAKEFRAQFDEAMRESELAEMKKDVEKLARETEATFNDTGRAMEQTIAEARQSVETSTQAPLMNLDPITPWPPAASPETPAATPAPALSPPAGEPPQQASATAEPANSPAERTGA